MAIFERVVEVIKSGVSGGAPGDSYEERFNSATADIIALQGVPEAEVEDALYKLRVNIYNNNSGRKGPSSVEAEEALNDLRRKQGKVSSAPKCVL